MLIPIDLYPVVTKYAATFIGSQPKDASYKWYTLEEFKKYASSLGKTPASLGVKRHLDHYDYNGREIPTGGVYVVTVTETKEVSYIPCANQLSGATDIIWEKYKGQFDQYVEYRKQSDRFG